MGSLSARAQRAAGSVHSVSQPRVPGGRDTLRSTCHMAGAPPGKLALECVFLKPHQPGLTHTTGPRQTLHQQLNSPVRLGSDPGDHRGPGRQGHMGFPWDFSTSHIKSGPAQLPESVGAPFPWPCRGLGPQAAGVLHVLRATWPTCVPTQSAPGRAAGMARLPGGSNEASERQPRFL